MKVLISGDFVINQNYEKSKISQELLNLFETSDLNIVNLEAPVTTTNTKILKTGPHLRADGFGTLNILKSLNVDVLTLANNHILDYDEQGVRDSLNFCAENNFQTVGAGMNLNEAAKTLYLDTQEGKIAIVNFAENEWSSATEETAGANPLDIIDNAQQIKEAKQKADFVFVIVHGGHEYYNLPSPRMQKQYRFYAEQGADIVIGHHTHCISGNETYKGVPIYYSLGNFLFTKSSSFDDWYLGLLLEVTIKNGEIIPKLYPVKQEKESFELSLLNGADREEIFNRISDYDKIIADSRKLKGEWEKYVDYKYETYLNYWSPTSFIKNHYIKAIFNRLGLRMLNKNSIAYTLNLMSCEAHSDLSKDIIKTYLNK